MKYISNFQIFIVDWTVLYWVVTRHWSLPVQSLLWSYFWSWCMCVLLSQ